MELNNALTLLPALVALAYVLWRREVIVALILAIFCSEILMLWSQGDFRIWNGVVYSLDRSIGVVTDAGNARLLMFSILMGALIALMRFSGGVEATVAMLVRRNIASTARRSGLVTFATGIVLFIESNLSILTSGILARGLFDRFNMSRERLAYIIDSTSAPVCILILLNGWGAFVLALISEFEMNQSAVSILIMSIPYNVYAWSTLLVVLYTVISGRTHFTLAASERDSPQLESAVGDEPKIDNGGKARYMLVPLFVLVSTMMLFMWLTGNGSLIQGSGSRSVLYATVFALVVSYLLLLFSHTDSHQKIIENAFKGIGEIMPLVAILLLSMTLGASVKELGTGAYLAGLVSDYLPISIVPAIVFLSGALISFTTGTSWGTFALLVPLAMPISIQLEVPPALMLSAILGGGIFGDHCSPVSDTTAVSSLAAGCDLLDHVRTQLPYALICGGVTLLAYLVLGTVLI